MRKILTLILLTAMFFAFTVSGYADSPFMHILSTSPGKMHTMGSYNYTYYGKADVHDQNKDLGMQQHDASLMLPMIKTENSDLSLYTTFRYTNWDTKAEFSNIDIGIPNNAYNLNFLPTYRYLFENGWLLGAVGQYGSASDKLFNSSDEMVYGGRLFLKIPSGERNYWMVLVDYSSNREFLRYIPLPGLGYMYNPDDDLQIFAGFPFAFIN